MDINLSYSGKRNLLELLKLSNPTFSDIEENQIKLLLIKPTTSTAHSTNGNTRCRIEGVAVNGLKGTWNVYYNRIDLISLQGKLLRIFNKLNGTQVLDYDQIQFRGLEVDDVHYTTQELISDLTSYRTVISKWLGVHSMRMSIIRDEGNEVTVRVEPEEDEECLYTGYLDIVFSRV